VLIGEGMASVVASSPIDWPSLYAHVEKNLPDYAHPGIPKIQRNNTLVFIRLQESIAITSTFKHQKVQLVKEGFDINQVSRVRSW
jgi:fatty-acyl-CoA synthase